MSYLLLFTEHSKGTYAEYLFDVRTWSHKAGYFKTRLRPYSYWVALTLLDKDVE